MGHHPRIVRWEVGRETLFHMVAQGWGVTITTESTASIPVSGLVFRPIADEPEQAEFHIVWSPHNQSQTLRNLLDLAGQMKREMGSMIRQEAFLLLRGSRSAVIPSRPSPLRGGAARQP